MRTRDADLIVTMVDFERPGVGTHQYMSQSSFEENVINNEYFQNSLEAGLIKCLLTHQGRDYADNDKSGTPYDDLLATHPDLCGVVRDVWLEGSKAMASIDLFDGQAFPAAAKLKDLIKKGTFVGVSMATECEINSQGNYDIKALLGCDFTLDNFFMGSGIVTIKKNFSRVNGSQKVNFSNKRVQLSKCFDKGAPLSEEEGSNLPKDVLQESIVNDYFGEDTEVLCKTYKKMPGYTPIFVFNHLSDLDKKQEHLLAYDWALGQFIGIHVEDLTGWDYAETNSDTHYLEKFMNLYLSPEQKLIALDKGEYLPLQTPKSMYYSRKNFATEEEIADLISEYGIEFLDEKHPDLAPQDNDTVFGNITDSQSARDLVTNCLFGGQFLTDFDYNVPINIGSEYFVTDGEGHLFSIEEQYLENYITDKIPEDEFIVWCEEQGYINIEEEVAAQNA